MDDVRAGAKILTLLGSPRTLSILHSLMGGTKSQFDLRRDIGTPAQSTLRSRLCKLEEIDAVERRRRDSFPGTLEYELTKSGLELLEVADSIERWLATGPGGPLEIGADPARTAIKGLVDGWLAKMLAPLSSKPRSLTELDKQLPDTSYPTIERRLETLRISGQVTPGERTQNGRPYEANLWLRHGIVPLVLAARWEHCHQPAGASPISISEIEAALTIGGPLVRLPRRQSGACEMTTTDTGPGGGKRHSRAIIEVTSNGTIGLAAEEAPNDMAVRVSGTRDAWFDAVVDGEMTELRIEGDKKLATALLETAHGLLARRNQKTEVPPGRCLTEALVLE